MHSHGFLRPATGFFTPHTLRYYLRVFFALLSTLYNKKEVVFTLPYLPNPWQRGANKIALTPGCLPLGSSVPPASHGRNAGGPPYPPIALILSSLFEKAEPITAQAAVYGLSIRPRRKRVLCRPIREIKRSPTYRSPAGKSSAFPANRSG